MCTGTHTHIVAFLWRDVHHGSTGRVRRGLMVRRTVIVYNPLFRIAAQV